MTEMSQTIETPREPAALPDAAPSAAGSGSPGQTDRPAVPAVGEPLSGPPRGALLILQPLNFSKYAVFYRGEQIAASSSPELEACFVLRQRGHTGLAYFFRPGSEVWDLRMNIEGAAKQYEKQLASLAKLRKRETRAQDRLDTIERSRQRRVAV